MPGKYHFDDETYDYERKLDLNGDYVAAFANWCRKFDEDLIRELESGTHDGDRKAQEVVDFVRASVAS